MTWIRDFVELTADQPPFWIAAFVALGAICAVLVIVGGAVIAVSALAWLRAALSPPALRDQQLRACDWPGTQTAARTIADREQIVATALNQVPRC